MNSESQGPPLLRRIIASELRRLRLEKGVTQQEAEKAADLGHSSLSRYESCVSSMQVPAAEKLLAYYGVEGRSLDALLDMVRRSRRRQRLAESGPTVWPPLENLVALERDAASIQEVVIRTVPGLLQTEDYARAVLKAGVIGAEVERHVAARLARAAILDRQDPPDYWIILCESALRCAVGGKKVMREQLRHLLDMIQKSSITMQVLPDAYGAHPAMLAPFTIHRFHLAPDYAMVYMDYLTGARYIDDPDEVKQYSHTYTHLIKAALPEEQSANLVAKTIEDLYS